MNTKNKDRGLKKTDTFPILVSDLDKLHDRIYALLDENAALKEQLPPETQPALTPPWTHINPADPGTFPPIHKHVMVAVYFLGAGTRVYIADIDTLGDWTLQDGNALGGTVYAYRELPDPPPFPGTAENQESEER